VGFLGGVFWVLLGGFFIANPACYHYDVTNKGRTKNPFATQRNWPTKYNEITILLFIIFNF
jgi:hypothetical protein